METRQMKQTPIARQLVGMGLLSGALLLGALPGTAMATAWFEAGGNLSLTLTVPTGVDVVSGVYSSFTQESTTGDATVYSLLSDPLSIAADATASSQQVSVGGEANPTTLGSAASAFSENGLDFSLFNTTATDQQVTVDYSYFLDVASGLDDAALEAAGATAGLNIGLAIPGSGIGQGIVDILDVLGNGGDFSEVLDGSFTIDLTAAGTANANNGVDGYLFAEGIATSNSAAPPTPNPTPGTLALFALGLGGLAARYRRRS